MLRPTDFAMKVFSIREWVLIVRQIVLKTHALQHVVSGTGLVEGEVEMPVIIEGQTDRLHRFAARSVCGGVYNVRHLVGLALDR